MIKLVVFDWNGTILADTKTVVKAINLGEMPVLKLPDMTVRKYQEIYDVPLHHYYRALGVSDEDHAKHAPALSEGFHKHYEQHIGRAKTRPGARKALDELHEKNIQRIILSNYIQHRIVEQLERLKLTHHFEAILANEHSGLVHHTGKQHRLETYLSMHNLKPSSVVIVGDSLEEIRIARALGIKVISISGGTCSIYRLNKGQPDALIHSLSQLNTVLEELA